VVVVISGHGSIEAAVKATKLGAFDFLEKPLTFEKVAVRVAKERVGAPAPDAGKQPVEGAIANSRYRIIGDCVPMKALRQQLALMAGTDGRVLVFGESGTGKELVAHAIHQMRPARQRAFRGSQLCGHPRRADRKRDVRGTAKGSFTSAHQDKIGKFHEEADGGTLFLDEVGDMSLRTQAKVLPARSKSSAFEPERSGIRQVDVRRGWRRRNKNLDEEIQRGILLREDLFHTGST